MGKQEEKNELKTVFVNPKMHDEDRKKALTRIRSEALDGIERIEAKIHKMKISGDYRYEDLENKYGSLHPDKDFIPEKEMPIYNKKYIKNLKGFRLNIFLEPLQPKAPQVHIQIHPYERTRPYHLKGFLMRLSRSLPKFNLSQIEYTLDIFCKDPLVVDLLFWVLRRSILVYRQRHTKLREESFSTGKRRNNTVYFGDDDKIYERGDDDDREDEGWDSEETNRVRLEHTSKRVELKRYKLNSVADFLKSPGFLMINQNVWNLKRFNVKRSAKLPREFDAYKELDEAKKPDSFQAEFIAARKKVKNPTKFLEDVEELMQLRKNLIDKMRLYDAQWGRYKYTV